MLWSDGFQTCFIKPKQNSAWTATVTVAPPCDDDRSKDHTHHIAIGQKGGRHDVVVDQFLDELQELRKGKWRWNGATGELVYTSFDMIAYMVSEVECYPCIIS